MSGRLLKPFLLGLSVVALAWFPAASAENGPRQAGEPPYRTVWDEVYSEAQAAEGQAVYLEACSSCHGQYLEGGGQRSPRLRGEQFFESWREDDLESLFTKIRTTMPRRSTRTMTADETLVLVSYLLQQNDFPAGADTLTADMLSDVRIEGRDGPEPLPNFSVIQLVGCLEKMDRGTWGLTRASRPLRLRTTDKLTAADLEVGASRPLGTLSFSLQNLYMLGAFNADDHVGRKMQARGTLIRRGSGDDRISITEMEPVGTCLP